MAKIFYLDTETTGFNRMSNDIIQLAFIIEVDGEIKGEYNLFSQPFDYSTIKEDALRKQKKTMDDIKRFPPPQEMYDTLISIMETYVDKYDKTDKFYPGGYNVKFDVDFLTAFFDKNSDGYYGAWFNWKLIDPYPLLHMLDSMGKLKLVDYKLGTVCKHFGIEINAHDALSDVRATVELIKLLQKKYLRDNKNGNKC